MKAVVGAPAVEQRRSVACRLRRRDVAKSDGVVAGRDDLGNDRRDVAESPIQQRSLPRAVEITLLLAPAPNAPDGEKPRAYRTLVSMEADGVTPFQPQVVPPPPPSSNNSRSSCRLFRRL